MRSPSRSRGVLQRCGRYVEDSYASHVAIEEIIHEGGHITADVDHSRACVESRTQQELDRHLQARLEPADLLGTLCSIDLSQ
ncbi:MAG: hypothetical protein ACREXP_13600 [Steroidobacteraceae bacterium]